ncbi:hypothetical protein Tco_1535167, partial [Tanacetum coccineum]
MFHLREDPIECINKAMAFLSAIASRVTVQQVQGRQHQSYAGTRNRGIVNTLKGNVLVGPPRVVKCYNYQGEGHMERQCTQSKRPMNAAWFKEKLMLVEAQEAAVILKFSLSVVPYSDSYPNDMINQYVQEMHCSEQTHVDDFEDNEIHSVEQMTDHVAHLDKENQTNKMVNESLTAELERYKEQITIFEQRLNVDLNQREKLIDSQMDDLIRDRNAKLAAFQQEIDTLKETLSNNVKEKESLSKTLTVFKTEYKEKESKYIDKEIVLEKQNKELENIICKMYRSTQAMHMLTKPQVFYDDTHKQALGYQNPFHLKKAQRMQPT